MKALSLLFILHNLASTCLLGQSVGGFTNREVYDFDIGDEFLYEVDFGTKYGKVNSHRQVIRKWMKQDSLFYEFRETSNGKCFIKGYGSLDSLVIPGFYFRYCQRMDSTKDSYCWDSLYTYMNTSMYEVKIYGIFSYFGAIYGRGIGNVRNYSGCDAGCISYVETLVAYRKKDKSYGEIEINTNTESSIFLFPNPTTNELNVLSGVPFHSYEIRDAMGKILIRKSTTYAYGTEFKSFHENIEGLPNAVYFVVLYNRNNVIASKKFFVVR